MNEPADTPELDFGEWAELAGRDPVAFERRRVGAVESLIALAPDVLGDRLRGLQWQVDQMRRRSRSPAGGCLRISNMMWDKVTGRDGLLDALDALSCGEARPRGKPSATILAFRRDAAPPGDG